LLPPGQARRARDRLENSPCGCSSLSKVATICPAAIVLFAQGCFHVVLVNRVGQEHHESASAGAGDTRAVSSGLKRASVEAFDVLITDLRSHALFRFPTAAQHLMEAAKVAAEKAFLH